MTVSSLFLFWAFFEMSGGTDFVPPSERADQRHAKVDPFANTAGFVMIPFDEPVIYAADSGPDLAVPTTSDAQIVQASLDDENATLMSAGLIALEGSAVVESAAIPRPDLRNVVGDAVNLRQGPGTGYGIIGTYPRGTEAEIITVADDWAEIRLLEDGKTGWMAAWLLSD